MEKGKTYNLDYLKSKYYPSINNANEVNPFINLIKGCGGLLPCGKKILPPLMYLPLSPHSPYHSYHDSHSKPLSHPPPQI